jgi:hypothetical protein
MAITRHPALTGKVYRTRNPKRKREKQENSFHGRVLDLIKKLKTAQEGRAKLERELEELRKGVRSPKLGNSNRDSYQRSAISDQPNLSRQRPSNRITKRGWPRRGNGTATSAR